MKHIIAVLTLFCATLHGFDAISYEGINIFDINIKNQGDVAYVSPGETIGIHAKYRFTEGRAGNSINQIIVGIDGIGSQTCIANGISIRQTDGSFKMCDFLSFSVTKKHIDITESVAHFAIVAPTEPGQYAVRFRRTQAYTPYDALSDHYWSKEKGPSEDATIGYIIVE